MAQTEFTDLLGADIDWSRIDQIIDPDTALEPVINDAAAQFLAQADAKAS